jgi:RNA polymerase sigma factor (sigma-70 family)
MTTRRLPPQSLAFLSSDRQLLRAYVEGGDPAAFAEVAKRYAGLARRAAADVCPAAADDVAQATLTLLGRKAKAVAGRESAAGWVFETARRLALKARTAAARRAKHEARATPPAAPVDPVDALSFGEVRAAVAEELARLPDELRVPLVLCYWEGASQPAAAVRLGCSLSTLKRRLDAGRERLAARLARRGFAASAVLAALTAIQSRGQSVGPVRVPTVGQDSDPVRTGSESCPTSVQSAMGLAAAVALVGGLALGLAPAGDGDSPPKDAPPRETVNVPAEDAFGDPLPPGAVARLGTLRFRTADFPKFIVPSADGKRLVSATGHLDSRLAIWETDTGKLIREVTPAGYPWPEAICWLPDGRGLAAYKIDIKDYVIWEFTDPEAKLPVGDRTNAFGLGSFSASAFAPDGTLFAGGERAGPALLAGKLQVWPVRPGRPVGEAEPRFVVDKPDGFVALTFTPDGQRLVGMTQGRQPDRMPKGPAGPIEPGEAAEVLRVFVWDAATGEELQAFDVPAAEWGRYHHTRPTVPHAVSPDGKTLFTAPQGGHVQAFDLATGKRRFDVAALGPLEGAAKGAWPGRKVQVTELAVTPDGKTLVAAEMIGRTVGLDAATGAVQWRGGREMDTVYALAMFPDSKRFALGYGNRQIGVYDATTGKSVLEPAGHRGGMSAVRIAPDGRSAMTAGWDNVLFRWDLATGRHLGRVEAADKVRVASFAPNGRRAISNEGVLDATTGKLLVPQERPHLGYVNLARAGRVAWLPDGSVVIAEQENLAARYAADGKKLAEYVVAKPGKPRTGPSVAGVAASPDGKTVVLVGEGATPPAPDGLPTLRSDVGWVAVFDADTGAKRREWESKSSGPAGGFTGVTFLPDGSQVVLSRWVDQMARRADRPEVAPDGTSALVLFDPATGARRMPFDVPDPAADQRMVNSVAVAPSGTQLVAVEWDRSLTLYETASGGIRRRLRGHRGPIGQTEFTPNGTRLVTVSDDATGLVWDTAPPRPAGELPLSDADRQRRWGVLLSTDAEAAHKAMGELAADPDGVAFLKAHLKHTPAPADADLDRLVAKLGATAFADRQAAARDLDALGGLAVPRVRARLAGVTSAEVRQRLEEFLKRHDRPERLTGPRLRELRAVELLEVIGTPEARAVLVELSRGETPLAKAAARATERTK